MAVGLPDWQRGISVNVSLESPDFPTTFVARPQGTGHTRNSGSTTTADYTEIASYVPATDHRAYLSKASAYCVNAHYFQVLLDSDVVGEALIPAGSWYVDYWPWGTYLQGNGAKKVKLQAKAVATGETLNGILFYEDVASL